MILRVFEGRLKPSSEQEFMVGERELLTRRDIEGLLGMSIGRRLAGSATDVITISLWRDRAAIERFADHGIDKPVFRADREALVETWSLRHFDSVDAPEMDGAAAPI